MDQGFTPTAPQVAAMRQVLGGTSPWNSRRAMREALRLADLVDDQGQLTAVGLRSLIDGKHLNRSEAAKARAMLPEREAADVQARTLRIMRLREVLIKHGLRAARPDDEVLALARDLAAAL